MEIIIRLKPLLSYVNLILDAHAISVNNIPDYELKNNNEDTSGIGKGGLCNVEL